MQRDILGRNAEKDMGIRTRNLATATPLASTSVTNGHTEFNGNESLMVKGSQLVAGWLIVTGTLKVVGQFLLQGITTITGALSITGPNTTITGPLHVQGNQDNTGTLAVKGAATLENDLTVMGSGKILVGSMTISTQAGGYGQLLSPSPVYLNAPFVVASGVFTALGNVNVSGALANPGIALKAGAANNLHIDAAGRIWRTS